MFKWSCNRGEFLILLKSLFVKYRMPCGTLIFLRSSIRIMIDCFCYLLCQEGKLKVST